MHPSRLYSNRQCLSLNKLRELIELSDYCCGFFHPAGCRGRAGGADPTLDFGVLCWRESNHLSRLCDRQVSVQKTSAQNSGNNFARTLIDRWLARRVDSAGNTSPQDPQATLPAGALAHGIAQLWVVCLVADARIVKRGDLCTQATKFTRP